MAYSSERVLAYEDQVQKEIGYVSFSDISSCDWSFAMVLGNKTLSNRHTHIRVYRCVYVHKVPYFLHSMSLNFSLKPKTVCDYNSVGFLMYNNLITVSITQSEIAF